MRRKDKHWSEAYAEGNNFRGARLLNCACIFARVYIPHPLEQRAERGISFVKSGKMRVKASVQEPFSVMPRHLLAVNPCIPVDVSSITVRAFPMRRDTFFSGTNPNGPWAVSRRL